MAANMVTRMASRVGRALALAHTVDAPVTRQAAGKGIATDIQPSTRAGSGFASVLSGILGSNNGYAPPPPGTYATYRRIRSDPTVALALAATTMPVQFAPWVYEAKDEVPDEWVEFAQSMLDPLRWDFVQQANRRWYYGWQSFEREYEIKDGRLVITRLKPLLPDVTEALVNERGSLVGLANGKTRLSADQMVWATYDSEADDPYGRSVFENIRHVWHDYNETLKNLGKYVIKNSGIIPVLTYPWNGKGTDGSGANADNLDLARTLLHQVTHALGIAIPNKIDPIYDDVATDMLRNGAHITELLGWQIKTLDFRSGAGAEISASAKHYESLMVRGLLRPERSLLEGTNGTLAEAAVHTDTGMAIADMLHHENTFIIQRPLDDVMAANFGDRARGAVTVKPGALTPAEKQYYRGFAEKVLTDPSNIDLLMAVADFDGIMDKGDVPKAAEVIDLSDVARAPDPGAAPTDQPAAPAPDQRETVRQGVETAIADMALNGAQVASIVTLAQQLASGLLPKEAVREIMLAAFPNISPDRINRIVAVLDKFVPPVPPAPPPRPQDPPTGRRGERDAKLSRSARVLAQRLRDGAI
jgi:hypothetical protein